jgi:hypothetical protein
MLGAAAGLKAEAAAVASCTATRRLLVPVKRAPVKIAQRTLVAARRNPLPAQLLHTPARLTLPLRAAEVVVDIRAVAVAVMPVAAVVMAAAADTDNRQLFYQFAG